MTEITHAMVLAAGLGKRLRPLTDSLPKPLVPVLGLSLLERVLDHLQAAGVAQAVVNLHHLGAQIRTALANRDNPKIIFSEETDLLETGGGVRRALPHLGTQPFYVINGDVLWRDGPSPALARLAGAWREADMDALLLLQPTTKATGYDGAGDYHQADDGRLRFGGPAPFVFAGVQILHPCLFAAAPPDPAFSLKRLYDGAQAQGRLFGLVHDGDWFHIGTIEGLRLAEEAMQS